MRPASFAFAPEGLKYLLLCAFFTQIVAMLDCEWGALVGLLVTAFVFNFFRDPDRVVPVGQGLAVSPADGKVILVDEAPDPISGELRLRVCVFMNVFNVHVNRSPVAGQVTDVVYHPGKFFNASFDKASTDNERCAVGLRDEDGRSLSMVQIAGLVARRIVCRVEPGDALGRGERFGLIQFGSRVDLYLPKDYEVVIRKGEKTLAGQTVIARVPAGAH